MGSIFFKSARSNFVIYLYVIEHDAMGPYSVFRDGVMVLAERSSIYKLDKF